MDHVGELGDRRAPGQRERLVVYPPVASGPYPDQAGQRPNRFSQPVEALVVEHRDRQDCVEPDRRPDRATAARRAASWGGRPPSSAPARRASRCPRRRPRGRLRRGSAGTRWPRAVDRRRSAAHRGARRPAPRSSWAPSIRPFDELDEHAADRRGQRRDGPERRERVVAASGCRRVPGGATSFPRCAGLRRTCRALPTHLERVAMDDLGADASDRAPLEPLAQVGPFRYPARRGARGSSQRAHSPPSRLEAAPSPRTCDAAVSSRSSFHSCGRRARHTAEGQCARQFPPLPDASLHWALSAVLTQNGGSARSGERDAWHSTASSSGARCGFPYTAPRFGAVSPRLRIRHDRDPALPPCTGPRAGRTRVRGGPGAVGHVVHTPDYRAAALDDLDEGVGYANMSFDTVLEHGRPRSSRTSSSTPALAGRDAGTAACPDTAWHPRRVVTWTPRLGDGWAAGGSTPDTHDGRRPLGQRRPSRRARQQQRGSLPVPRRPAPLRGNSTRRPRGCSASRGCIVPRDGRVGRLRRTHDDVPALHADPAESPSAVSRRPRHRPRRALRP